MKTKKMGLLLFCLFAFHYCSIDNIKESDDIDLNGDWNVYHLRFDDVIIDTTFILIYHKNNQIIFTENVDTISTGTIVKDTIICTDMYGLGFSKIFIDDEEHMHSELPMVEYSNGLKFER